MATNMFVEFSGIKGECDTDSHHPYWCEITSLKQGFTNENAPLADGATTTAPRRGKHKAIEIKKVIDTASMGLMKACWKGEMVEKVVIECFRAGKGIDNENQPIKYFSIILENVIIKTFKYDVDEGKLVAEELELVAAKVSYEYRQMDKRTGAAREILTGKAGITLGKDDYDGSKNRSSRKEQVAELIGALEAGGQQPVT